jgi:hypothetical protein
MTKARHGEPVNKRNRLLWCILLVAGWLAVGQSAAAVRLDLDRNRVTEGETVTLTFLTDDPKQSLDADFSVLEPDFEILDRRSETQLSIVNGQQTALVRLLLTVEPRRSGELTIPAFDFGGIRTQPAVLRVDPAPELEPGALPPVFIEVEVTPDEGPYYVHAQLGLVVRVFYQQNLTEAAISQPEPEPASVRLLQETPYQSERGGERYRVLERRYAVFPERSGEMVLPAMQLSGRLIERRNSSIWQPTVRGRRITVESDPIRIDIQSRPAASAGPDWQPARDFSLTQQISATNALRVGEPVTRTIIIDAVGLEENMIAEPAWPELPGARIYPDQPQGISRDDGQWVLGHKEFRYAVVPEQEGELVLPELTVHWWDTANDRQRSAVLPAKVLAVGPSALVPPPATAPPAAVPGGAAAAAPPAAPGDAGYWRPLALAFAALWVLTLLVGGGIWSRQRQSAARAAGQETRVGPDESAALATLRGACESGDPAAARRALQAWLRVHGPAGGGSLLEFASRCDDGVLREQIYALDAEGYRPQSETEWSGRACWSQFDAWRRSWVSSQREQQPELTDLYARQNRVS